MGALLVGPVARRDPSLLGRRVRAGQLRRLAGRRPVRAVLLVARHHGRVVFDPPYADLASPPASKASSRGAPTTPGSTPRGPTRRPCSPNSISGSGPTRRAASHYAIPWSSVDATRAMARGSSRVVRPGPTAARWLLTERIADWDLAIVSVVGAPLRGRRALARRRRRPPAARPSVRIGRRRGHGGRCTAADRPHDRRARRRDRPRRRSSCSPWVGWASTAPTSRAWDCCPSCLLPLVVRRARSSQVPTRVLGRPRTRGPVSPMARGRLGLATHVVCRRRTARPGPAPSSGTCPEPVLAPVRARPVAAAPNRHEPVGFANLELAPGDVVPAVVAADASVRVAVVLPREDTGQPARSRARRHRRRLRLRARVRRPRTAGGGDPRSADRRARGAARRTAGSDLGSAAAPRLGGRSRRRLAGQRGSRSSTPSTDSSAPCRTGGPAVTRDPTGSPTSPAAASNRATTASPRRSTWRRHSPISSPDAPSTASPARRFASARA